MKRLLALLFLFSVPLLLLAQAVTGDSSDIIPIPPALGHDAALQDFLTLYDGLYGAIVIILGYLHNWIPGLNYINQKWLRIVLIGIVAAVIFVALGFTNGLSTLFVFLQATGFYSLILKRVAPSAAVTPAKPTTV